MNRLAAALLAGSVAVLDAPADRIAAALARFADHCRADAGALWGISLCGKALIADFEAGRLYASEPDARGALADIGGLHAGPLPASLPQANTGVDWQGQRWTQVLWPLPEDPEEQMRLLLHESFHRIQPQLGLVGEENRNAHLDEADGRVWMRLEWRALAAALSAADWRAAFADAIAFRRHRYRLIEAARAGEWALEHNEGLAEYTGVRLAYVGQAALAHTVAALAEADGWEHLGRRFAYVTGPAWGLLLDRLAPDWRRQALDGADFLKIADRAMPEPAPLTRRVARAYGLDEIRAQEAELVRSRAAEREQQRAVLLGPEALVLPLAEAQMSFDPRAVSALPPDGTIYHGLTLTDLWGRVEVSGPALISTDFTSLRISPPTQSTEQGLAGADWQLALDPDWGYTEGRLAPRGSAD